MIVPGGGISLDGTRWMPCKPGMRVEERHLAAVVRIHEHRQHLAAKQARQHVDMHEKLEREATHRALSSENPPPGTIICTCG